VILFCFKACSSSNNLKYSFILIVNFFVEGEGTQSMISSFFI
jgi:hypothetical protein